VKQTEPPSRPRRAFEQPGTRGESGGERRAKADDETRLSKASSPPPGSVGGADQVGVGVVPSRNPEVAEART
jgi:hypothetical protein